MKELIVYGAMCSWYGTLDEAGSLGSALSNLPCCPFCKGVLLQTEKTEWDANVEIHSRKPGNEDYKEFLVWLKARNQCWKSFGRALLYFRTDKLLTGSIASDPALAKAEEKLRRNL